MGAYNTEYTEALRSGSLSSNIRAVFNASHMLDCQLPSIPNSASMRQIQRICSLSQISDRAVKRDLARAPEGSQVIRDIVKQPL